MSTMPTGKNFFCEVTHRTGCRLGGPAVQSDEVVHAISSGSRGRLTSYPVGFRTLPTTGRRSVAVLALHEYHLPPVPELPGPPALLRLVLRAPADAGRRRRFTSAGAPKADPGGETDGDGRD